MNWYKRYIGDYQRDTGHLSMMEHGAYNILLDSYYATESPLPLDLPALYRLTRAISAEEKAAVDSVLARYWVKSASGWTSQRADREIAKSAAQAEVNRALGKLGGRPRKTEPEPNRFTENNRTGTESVLESKPNRNPNQTTRLPDFQTPDPRHHTQTPDPDKIHPHSTSQQDPTIAPPKRKKRAPSVASEKTAAIWEAYSKAYYHRYGVDPIRNAKVNAQIQQLSQRLGDDAPHVAAYYVSHGAQWYVSKGHAVGQLLADAEKLHTEWRTGSQITNTTARLADRTSHTAGVFQELIEEERAKQAQQEATA